MSSSQIIKDYRDLESSAINRILVKEDYIEVLFVSSDKVYKYQRNIVDFDNTLQECIDKKESVGKFINQSIKESKLILMQCINE
jgi:hypothetical protein